MRSAIAFVLALSIVTPVVAQSPMSPAERERARIHTRIGWEHMRAEQWEQAAKAFQQAIDSDRTFEHAYYGLGRADLAMKKYIEAIAALEKCRDIYTARTGKQFASAQEAQRFRQDRITELDEQIRYQQAARPAGGGSAREQTTVRQLQLARQNMEESLKRGTNMSIENSVPPWVSLSLGSAYFRSGKLTDAEREYKATVAADAKSGEAFSNLAVVYLETGRYAEAEDALKSAKKTGFRVHPQLEQDIKDRKKSGS